MKLIYLEKFKNEKNNNLIYRIHFMGIKFSLSIYEQLSIFDALFTPVKYPLFRYKYNKYINKKDKKIIKRLIVTNGNLNLINTLSIINQHNLNKNAKNDFANWSGISNPEFETTTEEIIKQAGGNRQFRFYLCGRLKDVVNYFVKNLLCEYDEIFCPNFPELIEIYQKLFPKSKFFVTEEGVCNLALFDIIKNVEKCIFSNYLNKLDFSCTNKAILSMGGGAPDAFNKEEFLKIAEKLEKKYPFDIELKQEDKNVIFCGTYSGLKFWTLEEIINYQNNIIENLLEKGYTVIFKPHPRDGYKYKENEKFKILKTKIPLECYSLKDKCLAVVSLFSSASCQIYHYQGIAGFCSHNLIRNTDDFGLNVIEQYTPPVESLLEINANGRTFKELQIQITNKYLDYIKEKPFLHENKLLNEFYERKTFS